MLTLADELGNIHPERRAASLVFFLADETKEILLGRHTRGPFVGTRSGVWGKFESDADTDIPDCAIRESEQELGVEGLEKHRLALVAVLVCETIGWMNRRVPVYTYHLPTRDALPYTENSDGMDEFRRYSPAYLPESLKWWTGELIMHIASWSTQCAYMHIANKKEGDLVHFCELSPLSEDRYREYYAKIM